MGRGLTGGYKNVAGITGEPGGVYFADGPGQSPDPWSPLKLLGHNFLDFEEL